MDRVGSRSNMAQDCLKGTAAVMKAVVEAEVIGLVNRVELGSASKPATITSNAIGRTLRKTDRSYAGSPPVYGTIKPR